MSEENGLNLKELGKRAFSYFGGLSKSEVKQLINYTMIIENASGNLRGSLTSMSGTLKEKLDKIDELEKHISDLNARLEEKQALVDEANKEAASLREDNNFFLRKLKDIKEAAEDAL